MDVGREKGVLSLQVKSLVMGCASSPADFYTQKQLLLSAHLSHRNSLCPSVCSSVRLSHGWISQNGAI